MEIAVDRAWHRGVVLRRVGGLCGTAVEVQHIAAVHCGCNLCRCSNSLAFPFRHLFLSHHRCSRLVGRDPVCAPRRVEVRQSNVPSRAHLVSPGFRYHGAHRGAIGAHHDLNLGQGQAAEWSERIASLTSLQLVRLSLAASPPPARWVSLCQQWDKRKPQRCGSENLAGCEWTFRDLPWVDTLVGMVDSLGPTHDRFWGEVLKARVPAWWAGSVPRGVVGLNALRPFAIINSACVVSLGGRVAVPQGQLVWLDEDRIRVPPSWPDGGGRNGHP